MWSSMDGVNGPQANVESRASVDRKCTAGKIVQL